MTIEPLVVPMPASQDLHWKATLRSSKRAFVVMGVPSSGTRLMARLLVAAGCHSDKPDAQPFEHNDFWEGEKPTQELIIVRRHVAIGRSPFWAKDENIITALRMESYDVFGIVMSRCQIIIEQSMIAAPHTDTLDKARGQVQFCWQNILRNIPMDCPFDVVQYESLVKHPRQYLDLLGARWGLTFPDEVECITDGNEKYWEALEGRE